MVFDAAMSGVNLDKEIKKAEKAEEGKVFMFKDPKEYEKMPEEERIALTKKMMGQHKAQLGE
jgi:hypothetical protein